MFKYLRRKFLKRSKYYKADKVVIESIKELIADLSKEIRICHSLEPEKSSDGEDLKWLTDTALVLTRIIIALLDSQRDTTELINAVANIRINRTSASNKHYLIKCCNVDIIYHTRFITICDLIIKDVPENVRKESLKLANLIVE